MGALSKCVVVGRDGSVDALLRVRLDRPRGRGREIIGGGAGADIGQLSLSLLRYAIAHYSIVLDNFRLVPKLSDEFLYAGHPNSRLSRTRRFNLESR